MSRSVEFTVHGKPVPYERVASARNGKKYVPPDSSRYRKLVAWVALEARQRASAWPPPCATAFAVVLHVYRMPPKGKAKRGDADNYAKNALDALSGVLFEDDRQVRRLVVEILDAEVGKERMDMLVEAWP
jgi:Holliday junction resolvase RusA-like endonuclease